MTLEEYHTYMINSIKEAAKVFCDKIVLVPEYTAEDMLNDSIITPYSSSRVQYWYYNGGTSGNYLRVTTQTYYAGSTLMYYSSVKPSLYSRIIPNIYPSFEHYPSDFSYDFISNGTSLYLNVPGILRNSSTSGTSKTVQLYFDVNQTNYFSGI